MTTNNNNNPLPYSYSQQSTTTTTPITPPPPSSTTTTNTNNTDDTILLLSDAKDQSTTDDETKPNKYLTSSRYKIAIISFILFLFIIFVTTPINKKHSSAVSVTPSTTTTQSNSNTNTNDHEESNLFQQLFSTEDDDLQFELAGEHVNCNQSFLNSLLPTTSWQYQVRAADCGAGYDFHNAATRTMETKTKIVLYGSEMPNLVHLSGCPNGGGHLQCPWHPDCSFTIVPTGGEHHLQDADVVVVATRDYHSLLQHHNKKENQFRVLYYREAFWPGVPVPVQLSEFDFEMGIHYRAGILNPLYLRRPRTLLNTQLFPFVPVEHRPNFAMSIISDCHASSQRQIYIDHLSDYLGAHRIHQYGACGNRKLPPPPVQNAAKVISTYKFYLSFENTIQQGYVTEKLFTVLNMGGIIPVYYGAPDVPNITVTPSYINAMDFSSPKALGQYLLFLEKNPSEYEKYHIWRSSPKYFHPEYLRLVQRQMPGQEELLKYRERGFDKFPRRAACCRLCDLDFVQNSQQRRQLTDLPHAKWNIDQINHHVFGGGMYNKKKEGGSSKLLRMEDEGDT
jgi:hypothetical protein